MPPSLVMPGIVTAFLGNEASLVTPRPEDVEQYGTAKIPDREERLAVRELTFFRARPWDYLEKKLTQAGCVSPIAQMQEQISNYRASLKPVPQSSLALLNSPRAYLREAEEKSLLEKGITRRDIAGMTISDSDIVSPHSLAFSSAEDEHADHLLDQYYPVLQQSIEELFVESENKQESLEFIARAAKYLDVLSVSFLYSSRQKKLNNPQILDLIANKISWLAHNPVEPKKYLRPLFNFLSYFEMNSAAAASVFRDILHTQKYSHPLEYALQPKQSSEQEIDTSKPKVGLELEFVPLVISSVGIPDGFELGVDGGGSMPELRRENKGHLHFDDGYKQQLFDLWYFAKMGQVRGASVHLHFDINSPEHGDILFKRFRKLLGEDSNTVRENALGTVEVRFNLSAYRYDDLRLDLAAPFFEQEFDIAKFIEFLLDYSKQGEIDKSMLAELPYFWQARIQKTSLQKEKDTSFVTVNQLLSLIATNGEYSSAVFDSLTKLEDRISYLDIVKVSEEVSWYEPIFLSVFKKLDGVLTYSQVVKMADVLVLENDKSEFTLDDVFEKLDKVADYQQALELCSMYSWDSHACVAIIEKFGESLSYDQAFELLEATSWNQNILPVVLKKVDGLITYEQMFSLLQKYPSLYRVQNSEMLMEKMPDSLTQEQVSELIESFGREIIFAIFKKLPLSARLIDAFSIKKLLNLLGKKKWAIDWTHLFEQPGKKMYPLAKFIET